MRRSDENVKFSSAIRAICFRSETNSSVKNKISSLFFTPVSIPLLWADSGNLPSYSVKLKSIDFTGFDDFYLPQTKTERDGYHCIMYRIVDKSIYPPCCFYLTMLYSFLNCIKNSYNIKYVVSISNILSSIPSFSIISTT